MPTRWLDQGATQALPIFRVSSRYHSGLVEVMFKNHVSDRTDWRKMLRGPAEAIDLSEQRDRLQIECADEIRLLQQQLGEDAITTLKDEKTFEISYPVQQYPQKISSMNFDKTPNIAGKLLGIKGQYLIMDIGVLNIRKFTGDQITMKA
jgi:predicted acylesterase/phospholipase RssA